MFRPIPSQNLPAREKHEALDYLKALGPIALAVVAAVQQSGLQFWLLFGFAMFAFGAAFAGPVFRAVTRRRWGRHDDTIGREAIPELRLLVHRFQEIVDGSRNDTLEAIVRNGLQNQPEVLERLKMGSDHWLSATAAHLSDRLRDKPTGLGYLTRATAEFHTILHAYGDQCLAPIFEPSSPGDRQVLVDRCGRQVEAFRQRYMNLREDYAKYITAVLSRLHATPPLFPDLPRAQPLSG